MTEHVALETAIRFAGVAKSYGGQQVLRGVDFEVRAGEIFGLVGMNGAGKTTCIKALLDFQAVDAGAIEVFGRASAEVSARERLAYLPERFLPPYYQTGERFLSTMGELHRQTMDRDRLEALCAQLDFMPGVLSRPVRFYSKGMSQKLGLMGCFVSGKELHVLDEPMSGLDPKARVLVKRHIVTLAARGNTFFFSTHMLSDVQEICDRMGILHEGRIAFIGTPEACCRQFGVTNLEDAYLACIADVAK